MGRRDWRHIHAQFMGTQTTATQHTQTHMGTQTTATQHTQTHGNTCTSTHTQTHAQSHSQTHAQTHAQTYAQTGARAHTHVVCFVVVVGCAWLWLLAHLCFHFLVSDGVVVKI